MSADYAESIKDQYGFEITYFEDSPTMYQAVVGGQVAACFDDTPIMASNIKDTRIAMKLVVAPAMIRLSTALQSLMTASRS